MNMTKGIMAIVVLALLAMIGKASAVPSGKTLQFAGDNSPGKVIFDGKIHADNGLKCKECHADIFKMKKGAEKITKADHETGKFCFSCHKGTKAFSPANNCKKCHKKKWNGGDG